MNSTNNRLADDLRYVFGLEHLDAPSNRDVIHGHTEAGIHRDFKAQPGARVGDDLTIQREVAALRNFRQTSGEDNRVAAESHIAGLERV